MRTGRRVQGRQRRADGEHRGPGRLPAGGRWQMAPDQALLRPPGALPPPASVMFTLRVGLALDERFV